MLLLAGFTCGGRQIGKNGKSTNAKTRIFWNHLRLLSLLNFHGRGDICSISHSTCVNAYSKLVISSPIPSADCCCARASNS